MLAFLLCVIAHHLECAQRDGHILAVMAVVFNQPAEIRVVNGRVLDVEPQGRGLDVYIANNSATHKRKRRKMAAGTAHNKRALGHGQVV